MTVCYQTYDITLGPDPDHKYVVEELCFRGPTLQSARDAIDAKVATLPTWSAKTKRIIDYGS